MSKTVLGFVVAGLLSCGTALAQQPPAQPQPAAQPKPPQQPQPAAQPQPPQQPRPAAQPAPADPDAPEATRRSDPGQNVNVKLDVTITDQAGTGEPSRKVITLIVADRQNGSIRSKGRVSDGRRAAHVTINVDARPVIESDGRVRVDLGLEYQPTPPDVAAAPAGRSDSQPMLPMLDAPTNLNQRIAVILHEGKPLVISQAVDPATDRKISVELKATILK